MDLAFIALGLGLVYFAVQVPLGPHKTPLQRNIGAVVVFVGMVLFLLLVPGVI